MRQDHDGLASLLEAAASPVRLAILESLRVPCSLSQIRVRQQPDKPYMSRQSVSWHLDRLMDAGLVRRIRKGSRQYRYIVDHQGVFQLVEEVRHLTQMRPHAGTDDGATMADDSVRATTIPAPPRLLVAYGGSTRTAFDLNNGSREWWIGRSADCHICLDLDPFVSTRNCRIIQDDGFWVEDGESRNGTFVNHVPVEGRHPLDPGDLLTVGHSHLVFQA